MPALGWPALGWPALGWPGMERIRCACDYWLAGG
jgi:hypothetical protein